MPHQSEVNEGSPLATVIESDLIDNGSEVCALSGTFIIARLAQAGRNKSCRDVAMCEQCGSAISTNIQGQVNHLAADKHLKALVKLPTSVKKLPGCAKPVAKAAIKRYLDSASDDNDRPADREPKRPRREDAYNKEFNDRTANIIKILHIHVHA